MIFQDLRFLNEDEVRVLWVGVKSHDMIIQLQKKIEDALFPSFEKDLKFHPHITLFRMINPSDPKRFIESLKKIQIEPIEFEVKEFNLYKSNLTRNGPVYEIIENYELD